jgi:hypothetical protein
MNDTSVAEAVRIGPYSISYFHGWVVVNMKDRAIVNVAGTKAEAIEWAAAELAKENPTVAICPRCAGMWLVEKYPFGQSDIHACPECQPDSDTEKPLTIVRRATAADIEMLEPSPCHVRGVFGSLPVLTAADEACVAEVCGDTLAW